MHHPGQTTSDSPTGEYDFLAPVKGDGESKTAKTPDNCLMGLPVHAAVLVLHDPRCFLCNHEFLVRRHHKDLNL